MEHSSAKGVIALIMAAGTGERFGGEIPKCYVPLGNQTSLERSMELFMRHPRVETVRVVISRQHHPLYKRTNCEGTYFPPVIGGKTRQESVRKGLESIARAKPRIVLIHDAARPLASPELIDRILDKLHHAQATLPALPVIDTLKHERSGTFSTVERDGLFAAQTPQGFHFDTILAAHRKYQNEPVTDDIALAEKAGLHIGRVLGERKNIKLTTREDLTLMKALDTTKAGREVRTGMGFDVHAFTDHPGGAEKTITLCGVDILHEKRLSGHSDADAGLHALVDAILGALSEGDIGEHFPPSDPQWKGADSTRFLTHAKKLLQAKGGQLTHIDITFLAETPKLTPYKIAMREKLASLLSLDIGRISIKATTTESLGFLGRKEGLAAQAVVTLTLPEQP